MLLPLFFITFINKKKCMEIVIMILSVLLLIVLTIGIYELLKYEYYIMYFVTPIAWILTCVILGIIVFSFK